MREAWKYFNRYLETFSFEPTDAKVKEKPLSLRLVWSSVVAFFVIVVFFPDRLQVDICFFNGFLNNYF